jgi:hypothetical protein
MEMPRAMQMGRIDVPGHMEEEFNACYAYCAVVSDSMQLDRATKGDSISGWTSATTSIQRRSNHTSTGTAW